MFDSQPHVECPWGALVTKVVFRNIAFAEGTLPDVTQFTLDGEVVVVIVAANASNCTEVLGGGSSRSRDY